MKSTTIEEPVELGEAHISDTDICPPQKGEIVAGSSVQLLEEQASLFETRKHILFRLTAPTDWVTHNEKTADLISWGAERIMRPFGFTWGKPSQQKFEYSDSRGKYYVWETENIFRCKNPRLGLDFEIWAFGSCSSRNKLYSLRWDYEKKQKYLLPVEEIDEQNVKKHSWSACIRSAIGTGLGLRQLPKEIFPEGWWERINHVRYSEGKEGGQALDERFLRDEISRMLRDMCDRNPEKMVTEMVRLSEYAAQGGRVFQGVDNPLKLSGWRLQKTYERVLEEYQRLKQGV